MKFLFSTPQTTGRDVRTILKPLVLAAFAVQLTAIAVEPSVQWTKVLGGPGSDWPEDLAIAPNGQVYVVGDINQKVLHRFDQNGTLLGSQASRGEYIRGVAIDLAGNYYLTGQIKDSQRLGVGRTNDFYLAKYSPAGVLIWERTGGTLTSTNVNDYLGGRKAAVDPTGDIYVVGGSTGPAVFSGVTLPATPGGPLICKYAPDGSLLWVKRVEAAANPYSTVYATGISLAPDGSFALTGVLYGSTDFGGIVVSPAGPYSSDFLVAKYDPAGNVLWVRVGYGGEKGGVATDVEGNIYFNGQTAGVTDIHCGKFDPAGQLIWERSIPDARGSYVSLDAKGEPVFSACLTATVQLDDFVIPYNGLVSGLLSDVLICKADATGRFQWAIAESGTAGTWIERLRCDRKGNIYVAGAIRCDASDSCTGMLGSSSMKMLFPNLDNRPDVFIARLFDADAVVPELQIAPAPSALALSWPVEATNYVLEATTSLPAVSWTTVTNTPTITTSERSVQLPLTGPAQFFRLRQP